MRRSAIPSDIRTHDVHSPLRKAECTVSDDIVTLTESPRLKDAVDHVMYIAA